MSNPFPIPLRYCNDSAKSALLTVHPNIRKWLNSPKPYDSGAVILGPTGCGKTLAAASVAFETMAVHSHTWTKWIRADELSRILCERGSSEMLQKLKEARLLVIDELGYERFPELILEVLGVRHDNNRPTIVTSGLTHGELLKRYGDATVRRVVEIGNGCAFGCWG